MRPTLTVIGTVLAVLGLASTAVAQNLVSNGGFENGASGWQGGSVVAEQPHGGSACLLVEDADPQASVSAQTAELLALAAGQAYRLGAWVSTAAVSLQGGGGTSGLRHGFQGKSVDLPKPHEQY